MDATRAVEAPARAELYLCLARAFMTPREEALAHAMRDALAGDLEALGEDLGLAVAEPLAAYRAAMQRLRDPLALLQVYSAIFLAPPVAAWINAGHYLDGALNGGSVRGMEQAYRACGMARDDGFHDLADHVSVQLEFVGWLHARRAASMEAGDAGPALPVDPDEFLGAYAMRWIDRFCADVAAASAARELAANPYLPLARILQQAVTRHAVVPVEDAGTARRRRAIGKARERYAGRDITEEDLAEMRRKLEARGLSADHLSVPLALR